jgi:hypothetical protein
MNGLLRLLGLGPLLEPVEAVVLESVAARLEPTTAALLRQQVAAIHHVRRVFQGKEVNLQARRGQDDALEERLRFSNQANHDLLATVWFAGQGASKRLKADVWIVKGRVFSLLFNQPPDLFFGGLPARERLQVAEVRLWFDPMSPQTVQVPAREIVLSGWVAEWRNTGRLSGVQAPLPADQRAAVLERIDAAFPRDYLELLEQTDGATIFGWTVFGVRGIRAVVLPDATYYMLAERDGAVCVREEGRDEALYAFDYSGELSRPESVGRSLREALATKRSS